MLNKNYNGRSNNLFGSNNLGLPNRENFGMNYNNQFNNQFQNKSFSNNQNNYNSQNRKPSFLPNINNTLPQINPQV